MMHPYDELLADAYSCMIQSVGKLRAYMPAKQFFFEPLKQKTHCYQHEPSRRAAEELLMHRDHVQSLC